MDFKNFYAYQDGNRFGMKSDRLAQAIVQASANDPSLMLRAEEGIDYIVAGFDSNEGMLRFATTDTKENALELVDDLKQQADIHQIMYERPKKDFNSLQRTDDGWSEL